MKEAVDGLRFAHLVIEPHHKSVPPPNALSKNRVGQPGGPNDDGEGWSAFPAKTSQNRLKFAPAGAVHDAGSGRSSGRCRTITFLSI